MRIIIPVTCKGVMQYTNPFLFFHKIMDPKNGRTGDGLPGIVWLLVGWCVMIGSLLLRWYWLVGCSVCWVDHWSERPCIWPSDIIVSALRGRRRLVESGESPPLFIKIKDAMVNGTVYIYIYIHILVGGLEDFFFHSVGKNHPNWRTHIFQRG